MRGPRLYVGVVAERVDSAISLELAALAEGGGGGGGGAGGGGGDGGDGGGLMSDRAGGNGVLGVHGEEAFVFLRFVYIFFSYSISFFFLEGSSSRCVGC
jgi:hypothetical protein